MPINSYKIKHSPLGTTGGGFRNILVIGADGVSRFADWTDRGTCILFGDAAGAVIIQVRCQYLLFALFWMMQSSDSTTFSNYCRF